MEEGTNLLAADLSAASQTSKERHETMHNLQKEAFQLANYYFVFQGVIFTAFYSTPSTLKCEYRWVPFTLSLFAGVLNLFALLTIALKYKKLLDETDHKATTLQPEEGPSEPITDQRRGGNSQSPPIMVRCVGNWRMLYVVGCMGFFFAFFVVTLVGCMVITCGKN